MFYFSIPNLPFFYLVFRAWSHWRALSGSKHVEFLLDNKLITTKPSRILDDLYSPGRNPFGTSSSSIDSEPFEERMVLHKSNGKRIAEALGLPELDIELDRAVWQVEKALKAEKDQKEEKAKLDKEELDKANAESKKEK